MQKEKIIEEILNILRQQNKEFDGNLYSFSYLKQKSDQEIKYLPSIALTDFESIKKYKELYAELYAQLCKGKTISLETFIKSTQDLIFEGNFNVEEITKLIKDKEEYRVFDISKIYGLSLVNNSSYKIGKFVFVKKDELNNYLINNTKIDYQNEFNSLSIKLIDSEGQNEDNFVYLINNHIVIDNMYSQAISRNESQSLLSAIKYMTCIRNERFYIDDKPFKTFPSNNYQYSDKFSNLLFSSKINFKDRAIPIDDQYFINPENILIWNMISKEESNLKPIEKKILSSIDWVSKSLDEDNYALVTTELSMAFETLLFKRNKGLISPSIGAKMSEAYAFINGNSYEERITLEKDFGDFYDNRSSVVHGLRLVKNDDFPISKYYDMIKKTISNLLMNKSFCSCNSIEEVYNVIDKMKYE